MQDQARQRHRSRNKRGQRKHKVVTLPDHESKSLRIACELLRWSKKVSSTRRNDRCRADGNVMSV
eukprot:751004-Hanusia_phi.AAC.8